MLALVVGATATSASAVTGDSASGHGTLLATNEDGKQVRRQFSFNAKRHADSTVSGHAVLINPAFTGENGTAPYRLHVDITCTTVVGNIAIFGGTTKRTNDPNLVDAVFFSRSGQRGAPQGRGQVQPRVLLGRRSDNDGRSAGLRSDGPD